MTRPNGRPDFVILGVPCESGVMVMASTELNEAELSYEAEFWENQMMEEMLSGYRIPPRRERYTLRTEMRGYVMVIGDSYPDALSKLFGQWSPSDNPQDVLDAVVRRVEPPRLRAIEGGRS